MKRAFVLRHGHIDKENKEYDTLNDDGVEFAERLNELLSNYGADISHAYYDFEKNHHERCKNTIDGLSCDKTAFGDREDLRNINEVLQHGAGDFAVCYRAPNIECGSLYHVLGFELHTNYHDKDYLDVVREVMKLGCKYIYVLEYKEDVWEQVDKIETGYDYNGKIKK